MLFGQAGRSFPGGLRSAAGNYWVARNLHPLGAATPLGKAEEVRDGWTHPAEPGPWPTLRLPLEVRRSPV